MLLHTYLNGKTESFTVTPLINMENDGMSFYVQALNGNSTLLEKRNPGGKWSKIKGDTFDEKTQQAICFGIDNTNSAEIFKDIMLFDDFQFK